MGAKIFPSPDGHAEVTRHARLILKEAGVGDRLPTPVDDVVACAELVVSREVTLSEEHEGFFTTSLKVLKSALKKAIGLVDLRENVIYLDTTVLPQKRAFLKLHETGHKVLPWQRDAYLYLDDETTLDIDVRQLFESEANRFAADVLFQIDRFDRDARELPMSLKSPLALAKRYGASAHASIRRYVENNERACAVLVVERIPEIRPEGTQFRVKKVVQSPKFVQRFEGLRWPKCLGPGSPLTEALLTGNRFLEGGEFTVQDRDGRQVRCAFNLFDNSYNAFLYVYPLDEQARTKKRIVVVR